MRPTVINNLDYATRDYEGFRQLMLNKLTELLPEYTDHRQSDAGIVILELNAMCLDILSYYIDSIANECFLVTASQRSNIMKFCKMLGYTPRFATSAKYSQIFVKADPSRTLVIPEGTKVKTYDPNPEKVAYFTTTSELTLGEGVRGDEKDESGNYIHTVEVVHGLYVRNELLNDNAHGEKNQKYALKYSPVLIDDNFLSVYVSDGGQGQGSQHWDRVTTFAGSNSSSKVFMVENNDYNETSILFGDGSFGLAPDNASITCTYLVGGGESGNVGLGAIKYLEDNLAGISSTMNVAVIAEGFEPETLDEIKLNAPMSYRNIWGALTLKDYAGTVKVHFPDVFDSEARRATDDWTQLAVDDVKIYLLTTLEINYAAENHLHSIPDSWYENNTDYTRITNNVQNFFSSDTDYVDIGANTVLDSARKLVGTRNIILDHSYFKGLDIAYSLMVRDHYDEYTITQQIEDYIINYLSVGNINYGEEISLQSLMYDILNRSGIEGIRYLNFTLSNIEPNYEDDYFSFVGGDLLIPKTGTIFTLNTLTKNVITTRNGMGGATNG